MVLYINPDQYYWYRYSGPLLVLPILLVAVSNGLSKYLAIHESQRRGKVSIELIVDYGRKIVNIGVIDPAEPNSQTLASKIVS